MRLKHIIISLAVLVLGLLSCNPTKKSIKRSENAFKSLMEEDSLKAANRFYKLAIRYPESDYYYKNLFNAGMLYFDLDSLEKSSVIFSSIAFPDFDLEPNEIELKDTTDSSRDLYITHTNYQFFSTRMLAEISLKEGDPQKAIYFLNYIRNFEYESDSALGERRQELSIAALRFRAYTEMKKVDSALLTMLPHALMPSPYHSHPGVEILVDYLKEEKLLIPVKKELDVAMSNMRVHPSFAEIPFRGSYVQLIPLADPTEELKKENIQSGKLFTRLNREIRLLSLDGKDIDPDVRNCNLD